MARTGTTRPMISVPQSAVVYARVSSKEQEREGYSIPAQLKLLKEYARVQGFNIVREYVDVETAKQTGRASFGKMAEYLKTRSVRVLLVEKTDRLYRNLKDWVTLDEIDLEIHVVKESVILSRDSRSSEKFMHGIKVLMAKNYIDNLSEEARKGMLEKAEQGIWPTKAPLGYRNVAGPNGKKVIEPDPEVAPIIARLFEWYATGEVSLKEAASKAANAGLKYRRTGATVPVSTVHTIMRNRLYIGEFMWNGRLYQGQHAPLITRQLWERVQSVLAGRNAKKQRGSEKRFAFSGLITCGHCGCALVGEIKKGRYVYYHCTGYKGKCPEPYVRQEVLEERFSQQMGRLSFDADFLEWVREALCESHSDELRKHEAAIARHQTEYDRLQIRLHAMYVDKLDGRVDVALFDQMSARWRAEQERCQQAIERHQSADQSYLESGVKILELARNARRLFQRQEAHEKRRLLNFVVSNCSWKGGQLTADFRQPFDLICETTARAAQLTAAGNSKAVKSDIWLGD